MFIPDQDVRGNERNVEVEEPRRSRTNLPCDTPPDMLPNPPDPFQWWKHRRRMAYVALVWCLFQTPMWVVLHIIYGLNLSALDVIIGWSYGVPFSILLAYFGNTLAEELVKRKRNW